MQFPGILLGILAFSFKNIGYALQKSGVNKAGAVQSENPEDNTTTDQAAQKILKTPIWWIGSFNFNWRSLPYFSVHFCSFNFDNALYGNRNGDFSPLLLVIFEGTYNLERMVGSSDYYCGDCFSESQR